MSNQSLTITGADEELLYLNLARELALGQRDLQTILAEYQVEWDRWELIRGNARFQQILTSEMTAWNAALNTHDRTRLKAAAMIEGWLKEANDRMHDPEENLSAKTEVAKLVSRIAEMGTTNAAVSGGGGERFSISINLGADTKLSFDKTVTPKVIEGEKVRDE